MKTKILVIALFSLAAIFGYGRNSLFTDTAQAKPTPTPKIDFDQKAALSKLREQIKGKENEPATKIFKNIQIAKDMSADRLLKVMEFGSAGSLGVSCTHCHVPDKWESEEKPQKQIARDMSLMVEKINKDLLKNIKGLMSPAPSVNCTTCHRGQIIPALSMQKPTPTQR